MTNTENTASAPDSGPSIPDQNDSDSSQNPLLLDTCLNDELPVFSSIRPHHVQPALRNVLQSNRAEIAELVKQSDYSWSNFINPLDDLSDRLQRVWSPVSHMNSVVNSDDLRKTYNECLPLISEYHTELGQHAGLYKAYQSLAESDAYQSYDVGQKTVIENALRGFRLSGINLNDSDKARFKQISLELTTLSATFSDNVLDATQAWKKHIEDKKQLKGIPPSSLAIIAQAAEQDKKTGWLLSLDFPVYLPVMTYADNRELRKEMHDAFVTRASDQGPNAGKWDNSKPMQDILRLRREKAKLLGFVNYAEYSLATKMADSCQEVLDFLQDLADRSKSQGSKDFAELQTFAKQLDDIDTLKPWDTAYYSEKLRQKTYSITQEELKPYFPEPQVLQGMFAVVEKLYDIQIDEQIQFDGWHDDVRLFIIRDAGDQIRGKFFLDLYARANKRGGAWMDDCICRRQVENQIQNPVAYLTCNFSPPVGDEPALFTHQEVTTLFHEFGHGLHHMLTKIDYIGVSGINGVAWDAVELPSQFMENWCWEKEALALITGHFETGETLPDGLFDKMQAAKNFQSGMHMVRQLEFGLFDIKMHAQYDAQQGARIQETLDAVRNEVSVVKTPAFNRFQHGFTHIFAGGYAAGYYSYMWAEVLSADAFAKFEEKGIFDAQTGHEFLQNILEKGGSQEPMELFVAFRGREPKIDALLRHSGIA